MRPKLDLPNCLAILRACDRRARTAKELQHATGMSPSTFFRVLNDLADQLGARVTCVDGRYRTQDWGIIDRERL